jgi:hypothetical protein
MVHGRFCACMVFACFAMVLGRGSEAQEEPLCSAGFGSFKSDFHTGVNVSVGAVKQAGFAGRMCSAKLEWEQQELVVAPSAYEVDLDAMGIDLGLGAPVATFQIRPTELDRFATYKIYSLKKKPQELRSITGGDDYSAADTDLDGKVEIWTHDAAAIDGFDNISFRSLEFPPTVVLRFEQKKLIEVNTEFLPEFDKQITALRAELNARDLGEFKQSNGTLVSASFVPVDQQQRLLKTKTKILEIVWSYFYSGREEDAWKALHEMWPEADAERVRTFMMQARARGIRAQVEGVSDRPPRSRLKKALVYDRLSGTDSEHENPLSADYAPGMSGPSKGEHLFEADTFPIPIMLRRPPPEKSSEGAPTAEVTVDLVVDAAGKVRSAKAEGKTPDEMVSYTESWKFIPAFKGGKPVATHLQMGVVPQR